MLGHLVSNKVLLSVASMVPSTDTWLIPSAIGYSLPLTAQAVFGEMCRAMLKSNHGLIPVTGVALAGYCSAEDPSGLIPTELLNSASYPT